MIKRLLYGLVFGLFVGGIVAAVAIRALGVLAFADTGGGTALAYVFAAVTGVMVGLVAGKPIWASGGQIEAGLKAFFGALLASGLLFALRRWVHFEADLSGIGAGPVGPLTLGSLPAISLPLIAAVLGGFYEADNTPETSDEKKLNASKESANNKNKVRVKAAPGRDQELVDDEIESPAKRTKR